MKEQKTGAQIVEAVQQIFKQYDTQFPDEGGLMDKDIPQLCARAKARRRAEFLDKAIDGLELSDAELNAWQKHHEDENEKKARDLFEGYLEQSDYKMAEYMINNMRKVWDLETRQGMAKRIGDQYMICPYEDLVDTVHSVKKKAKKINDEKVLESLKSA